MTSVFKIHPIEFKKKLEYINYIKNDIKKIYKYNFLEIIELKYDINVEVYYEIINIIEEFKLKNLLYFMNSRLLKINKRIIYDINDLNHDNINEIFNNFIVNDITLSIIIMNLITHYIFP